ncbi:GPW/gp25 family protein [Sphingomonas sp. ac-8]|uniref:GPW/gp25 family protein n=1 Tax=Sphingomonas sp. ac-8 TaxID=3242977 RepID=UPI003A7FBA91
MIGMDAETGKPLAGDAHLEQSLGRLLSTPIGTRVMRRDYGSALFELVDKPLSPLTRMRAFAATAVAIARWEPRLRLTRVSLAGEENAALGRAVLTLEGERTDTAGRNGLATLTIPLRPVTA